MRLWKPEIAVGVKLFLQLFMLAWWRRWKGFEIVCNGGGRGMAADPLKDMVVMEGRIGQ
jgi:hypothetical protein